MINKKNVVITIMLSALLSQVSYAGMNEAANAYRNQDYKLALKEFLPIANQGDMVAQYNLGVMYEKGIGTQVNYKEAFKWYSLAAKQGKAEAQNNLGMLYYKGRGVPMNVDKAEELLLIAKQSGIKEAYGNLGNLYRKKGGYTNLVLARDYYKTASSEGFIESQYNLAVMYWQGDGGPENIFLGYVWINVANKLAEEKNIQPPDLNLLYKMEPFLTSEQIYRAKQLAAEWTVGTVFQ